MRAAPACFAIACTLALMGAAGPLRGDDGGAGGAGGGAAGGAAAGAGGGGEPLAGIQASKTADNFGCSAAGAAREGTGAAGILLLGAALGARTRRRRRG